MSKKKQPKDRKLEVSRLLYNEHDLLLSLKDDLVRDFEAGKLTVEAVIWQAFGMGGSVVFDQVKGVNKCQE